MSPGADPDGAVGEFYRDLDRALAPIAARSAARLVCRAGCSGCCRDGITVFEVEARRIRRRHAELLAEGAPHPEGACAFLDGEGRCRIYEDRPYVCRTQGLPLRWLDPDRPGVELRDICPLNEEGEPLESLPREACWTLGPYEGRLASLQAGIRPGVRVALRDLFGAGGRSSG